MGFTLFKGQWENEKIKYWADSFINGFEGHYKLLKVTS